jgi:nicotinamidase-related amidase
MLASVPASAQPQVNLPAIPDPVAVRVNPDTTALLSLDFLESTCTRFERCLEGVPPAAAMLARARANGVLIVHTGSSAQLPEVAPINGVPGDQANRSIPRALRVPGRSEEIVIPGHGPDKFVETTLESTLSRRGIDTLIIDGFAANRAVMYTAMAATMRGYTVVVPEDASPGIAAGFDELVAWYQLLTQTGRTNPDNSPLAPEAVTLSRSDLINFE